VANAVPADRTEVNPSVVKHSDRQGLQGLSGARRIDQHQQSNFATFRLQLLRNLIGEYSLSAEPGDEARPGRVSLEDRADLVCGKFREILRQAHLEFVRNHEPNHRLIVAKITRERSKDREVPYCEERRKRAMRLDRNGRPPVGMIDLATDSRREALDGGHLEHRDKRDAET
jgi:hypothetical protein